MKIVSHSFGNNERIPARIAMGVPGPDGPVAGPNRNPHLSWSDVPEGTKSFALVCVDSDAPSKRDDANRKDRVVPYDLARAPFHHWVLVDIPARTTVIPEGQDSDGVTPRGKKAGKTEIGVRGINDYTSWFEGDAEMSGDYAGYDGPWPPFNDERLHHYRFTVYALDVPSLGLSGRFGAPEALQAMKGHVLDQATLVGTYALYPNARE